MPQTPEQRRAYQREYHRAWRARNPEKVKQAQRKNAEKNRDKNNRMRQAWRAANPDKEREQQRAYRAQHPWRQHAQFSEENYAAMWQSQDGRCYLCGEEMEPKSVRVDHDHSCCPKNASCPVCRRGLVHHRCNVLAGHADESPERLRRIADALEAAQLAVAQRKAAAGSGEQLTLSDSDCLLF
jgi:Recombination endonuclease VII